VATKGSVTTVAPARGDAALMRAKTEEVLALLDT